MSEYEVRAGGYPVEVTAGFADPTGLPYWQVHIPYGGDAWSYDRAQLSAWLRAAADRVDATPAATDPWAEQGPAGDPWGSDAERAAA